MDREVKVPDPMAGLAELHSGALPPRRESRVRMRAAQGGRVRGRGRRVDEARGG